MEAKPHHPGEFTSETKLHDLEKRVSARKVPIIDPGALDRTLAKLAAKKDTVRILHLGDSHVASDYITGMVRHGLQRLYGDAGRGFVHIDQLWGYGGRRLQRSDRDWTQERIVDAQGVGRPFGFSGMSIESKRRSAKATYRVLPDERIVRVYYQRQPHGAAVAISIGRKAIATFKTAGETKSEVFSTELPAGTGERTLTLTAKGAHARMYGISFERKAIGVLYESIGPVGADAKVYLQLDPKSFEEHLVAHHPDLIVLMVGGNDALKIRKGWTDLDKVTEDHQKLLAFLREKLPDADCMLWTPMDAGESKNGRIVSKKWLTEVREMQLRVAKANGCAVWDMYGSMGGEGSVARWEEARLMNKDLVHPKKAAADLLGTLFLEAWQDLVKP